MENAKTTVKNILIHPLPDKQTFTMFAEKPVLVAPSAPQTPQELHSNHVVRRRAATMGIVKG